MIITRSPLRITLGGGGTDLPSYYGNYGGFLIAAAIYNVHRDPEQSDPLQPLDFWPDEEVEIEMQPQSAEHIYATLSLVHAACALGRGE